MPSEDQQYHPVAAAVLVCSLATTLLFWAGKKKHAKAAMKADPNEVVVELLGVEKVLAGGGGGDNATSTLTWFQGDYSQVVDSLRERTGKILELNPWLAGRIEKRKEKNGAYALVYSTAKQASDLLATHFCCHESNELLSRDIPFDQLGAKCSELDLYVKVGPTLPLWRVHVIPCHKDPHQKFAVVVSISHALSDGHTFYRLHNMLLNSKETIEALQVERILTTEQEQIKVMGGEPEQKILQSAGFIVNCVYGVLHSLCTKTKTVGKMHLIHPQGMEEAKKQAAKVNNDVEFVSSNDVITSWFLQNCRCKFGMMALNFRGGRIAGHTETHAGNYENVICYRPQDSATPALIRQSIQPPIFRRRVTNQEPLPGFWGQASGSFAIATNWASFAKPCFLGTDCHEEFHMPLYDLSKLIPSTMVILVIFRAGPRGLGILYGGSEAKVADLQKAVPFLHSEQLLS
ncbi:expressed unknown protein [Seminavis robusta]|uniref:O-acyltransferase WSD1-like N-terminal domain-containing protein n=1 Tax=Seminavis robusta TaxID=568900 RepID=A0A9N8DW28_9STRA|nr:expressed unknown protein [Seminavis robusta]|eukprot:Sro406_g136390.1 n/a (460) ;mRNA; r:32405-33784